MVAPRIPADEAARLEVLRCYQILDTPPEREFDEIARIAAHVAGMPIALVTLVDEDRQWFKARLGPVPAQSPREISFCAHAILTPEEPLIVENPEKDPRFADNPDVTGGLMIRYYAGVPLVSSEGQPVGTLCVIDQNERKLAQDQVEVLRALARHVIALLELRKTARDLDLARRRIHDQDKALALHDLMLGVAHEVNNPLTSMRVSAEVLEMDMKTLRSAEARPENEKVHERMALQQRRIVDGIVRLARIGVTLKRITRRANEEPQPVGLDLLVASALDAAPVGARVERDLRSQAQVRVRPSEIRETIAALLANARESLPGGAGSISVRAIRADPKWARFEVEDDGVGIPSADHERIFTPFFTTKPPALGCSLAIAKRVIEDAGGRIGFYTRATGGTTFYVELPTTG